MLFRKKKPNALSVILIGTAVVLFWRGMWGFLDMYLFPDHELLSYGSSIGLGLFILIVTHHLVDELA